MIQKSYPIILQKKLGKEKMKILKFLKFLFFDYWRIPSGFYCHFPKGKSKKCPFWTYIEEYHHQENGYCNLLKIGDKEIANNNLNMTGLLWDQCKECTFKDNDYYFEAKYSKGFFRCTKYYILGFFEDIKYFCDEILK